MKNYTKNNTKNGIRFILGTTAITTAITLLTACGSGSSDATNDAIKDLNEHLGSSDPIDTQYVDHILSAELDTHFTSEGTTLVHKDGLSNGSVYDIDRVIISKVNSASTGDLFAFAYDGMFLKSLPSGTVPALYIDNDNNAATGESIAGIGADLLFVEGGTSASTHTKPDYSLYQHNGGGWTNYALTKLYINTEVDGLRKKVVIVPDTASANLALGLTGVKGVLALRSFTNGNPDTVASTSDKTTAFTFSTPAP